jgi:outer membrane lipoprotein LolB
MRWIVLMLAGLAGCTTAPVLKPVDSSPNLNVIQPARQFHLEGRISVKTASQTFSGTLSWTRAAGEDTLLLSGPLGQGAAEIHRQHGQVTLKTADGRQMTDDSDAQLMERVLGLRLPLDGLVYWLSGLPQPGVEFKAGMDQEGRFERLDQDGWHFEYSQFSRDGERWRPGRIFAHRGDELEFKFVVDAWETL